MSYKKGLILFCGFFLSVILLSGCETSKGVACAVGGTAGAAAYGVGKTATGVGKDSVTLWQGILRADDWFKKNLW